MTPVGGRRCIDQRSSAHLLTAYGRPPTAYRLDQRGAEALYSAFLFSAGKSLLVKEI